MKLPVLSAIPFLQADPNASLTKKSVRMVIAFGSASVLFILGATLVALTIAKTAVGPSTRPTTTSVVGTSATAITVTPSPESANTPSTPARKPQSI